MTSMVGISRPLKKTRVPVHPEASEASGPPPRGRQNRTNYGLEGKQACLSKFNSIDNHLVKLAFKRRRSYLCGECGGNSAIARSGAIKVGCCKRWQWIWWVNPPPPELRALSY
ncbi:hypothetical protein FOXG_07397 [Fusarium oxysporum f. sp. lycopersici 4287]|uniref:Uncharacterized protein n=2 Tax=Fusarium oxysporum TaxID=5507 RepID=A0A0J9WM72_FUSO4|nr:hypothetical protein FOXG_07397 [Fusarium oxysporum f. sp. lycopersici 4287]KNB05027.1 hypothetical protein FOXG_07397 [Fusarium oxysporum f. sp. lycopersici 4287]